ncbi:MAG: hypothetical protein LQ344_007890 [Seirophora lacunosa]|nr:MAG: hypothetical protein LQ344_007890 [Seirophora lacunosa]
MGTLVDITSEAANKNLRNDRSPSQTPKNTPAHSELTARGNFMTPTMSSSKKTTADSTSKGETRTFTPTSTNVEKAVTGKWMKRVGLQRVGADGTPRSKKEGSKQSRHVLTLPDQLAAPLQGQVSDSPRPTKSIAPFLSEKPLPSPPIAQLKTAHVEEPRSLIDASEKPLQRTSPKSPREKEEWPVLFPQKPTSPEGIQEMQQQSSPKQAHVSSTDQERSPLLSGAPLCTTTSQRKLISRAPSSRTMQRTPASRSYLRDFSAHNRPIEGQKDTAVDFSPEQGSASSMTLSRPPQAAHRLSAGAAAVEKSSTEAKTIKEPRQTKTSSLRARISAGQIIKDSPNKVLGFTDFTIQEAPPAKASKEDRGSSGSFRSRSSSSFSKTFAKKPSRDSLGGSRAPAQFVAGSRRPIVRRPGSRNSFRGESRASSPAFPEPSRPAPPIPTTNSVPPRKSSIPVPHDPGSNIATKDDLEHLPAQVTAANQIGVDKRASSSIELPEDASSVSINDQGPQLPIVGCLDENTYLESIAETPQSNFRSKRLSTKSPGYGPELKISHSANRIILGEGVSDKEITPVINTQKSTDLFRAAITNERKNVTNGRTLTGDPEKTSVRPLSSQGFAENQTHEVSAARAARTKKVNSVDLGGMLSIAESKPEPVAHTNEKSNARRSSATIGDPFSAIVKHRGSDAKGISKQERSGEADPVSSGAGIAPATSPVKDGATLIGEGMPIVPDVLLETRQEHARKLSGTACADEKKLQLTSTRSLPSTPPREAQSDGSPSSSTFPPRSSSRQKHPDYTVDGSTKSSSVSSVDRAAALLQTEIRSAQSVEAKLADSEASPQLPVIVNGTSGREIASQTIIADVGHKRDSAARESTKSQSSVSKGLKSTFRGLFHKRSSDNAEALHPRSTRKGGRGPTVTAHGSPFPSMSDIHPIYRPTQSSINRASATGQRPNSHGIPTAWPGTPTIASPMPSEISTTTTIAMDILETARKESHSPKKDRLLELGKLMVDTITQARDAEKAMEEAKQAARKAEVAHARCKKSVSDVAKLVKDWRNDIGRL